MKASLKYILLFLSFNVLLMCKKEDIVSREYPRLKTLAVSDITSEGARFNAKIIFRGDFEIINYGFVWAAYESPTIGKSDKLVYAEDIKSEYFSEQIETSLIENTSYFVRAFVETKDYLVYGENVSFISLGSQAPQVFSFSPQSGSWGDTITIKGKNFSYIPDSNIVEFGELAARVIASSDSTLAVVVPGIDNEDRVCLKVSISGNSTTTTEEFCYLLPEVFTVSPLDVTFGDTIIVTGANFGTSLHWNTVLLNNIEAEIIGLSKTKIEFIVPTKLTVRTNAITLKTVGKEIVLSEKLSLKPPVISSFSPVKATRPSQALSIYGENFNPDKSYNTIQIGGFDANIISAQHDLITVELPVELIPYYYISVFDTVNIKITVAKQFMSPEDQLEIYWQSTWTRKKDFPGPARYNAVAFSIGEYGYFGTGIGDDESSLLNDFWKYDPSIDEWVKIDDLPGKARAAASAFTIGNKGFVGLGSENYYWDNPENDANHFRDFYSYDPTLEDWVRMADFSGIGRHSAASFAVNSKGYIATGWWGLDNPLDQLKTTKDAWEYDPEFDSWAEIESFPDPSYMAVGFNLGNSVYIYNYDDLYEYKNNSWIKLSAPALTAWENIAFGINGLAYFGLGMPHQVSGTNLLYEYNPVSTTAVKRSISSNNMRSSSSVFVIDDKAYILGGLTYYSDRYYVLNDVWEFDPSKPEL